MVTGSAEHDAMNEARAKGAKGYLIKTTAADAMMLALQKVLGGESHFSDDLGFAQTAAHMTTRCEPI
jgi:DNA-binding NarL/FixJ family response regulator